jgi:hypothetical protein
MHDISYNNEVNMFSDKIVAINKYIACIAEGAIGEHSGQHTAMKCMSDTMIFQ